MGEGLEIGKPGGGVVRVAGDEFLPGAEAGTPGFETASQLEWYLRGDNSWLGSGEQGRRRRWALVRMSLLAARYGETGRYTGPLPKTKNGQVDHANVAANVIRWVEEALEPDSGQVEGSAFNNVVDWFDEGKLGPGVTEASGLEGEGRRQAAFVCVDHARLAAALLRQLGYHTQEVNVVVGLRPPVRRGRTIEWGNLFWSYQSAALRVFYHGRWNYFDAFLHTTDLERTIRATIFAPQTLRPKLTGVTRLEQVPKIDYKVFVAGGPVQSFTLSGSLRGGTKLTGPWVEIEAGEYDTKTKVLTRNSGKKK